MRSKVVKTLALGMLLSGVGMIAAQQPGSTPGGKRPGRGSGLPKPKVPEKSKLEEMLSEALKNNPDIRVAAAKLAEADAELNRTRLQVMQKVVTLYHAIETQKKTVARWESETNRINEMIKKGIVDPAVPSETENQLALAKGKLEELEAQLPALLGKSPRAQAVHALFGTLANPYLDLAFPYTYAPLTPNIKFALPITVDGSVFENPNVGKLVTVVESEKQQRATGPMSDRLRKALQTPIKVDYKNMELDDILDDLAKKVAGASFRVVQTRRHKINLRFEEALPLSAVLQALADEYQCCFYVREYGILASHPNAAPPGALRIEEFLRQKPADESHRPSSGGKNAPAESVQGVIESVGKDADGLLTISIGSDAGLAKGQTLELYWMPHKPPINDARFLGTVRILEARPQESVAQPVGGLKRKPQPGDRIVGQIQKK